MPRQNRVTPHGELIAVSDRGMFWGNRGVLVDGQGRLARYSRGQAWAICVLSFKGRRRQQWQPRRLTELYFLDEATGLAAGHRPCGECRYRDYQAFKRAWAAAAGGRDAPASGHGAQASGHGAPASGHGAPASGHGAPASGHGAPASGHGAPDELPGVREIDARLHADRLAGPGTRRTYQASLAELPSGVMVDIGGTPWLVHDGELLAWTPGGYERRPVASPTGPVTVITPRATVAVLAAGYQPVIHPSSRRA